MPSSTVEDYLKNLYLEQHVAEGGVVPMGRLAAIMHVTPGTATAMMKTLANSGLVDYEPRGGVSVSARGEQLALHVLRRHRLVELFLVKVLGLDWSVVHDEADALEHAISDRVLERMDALLGHPTVDPHGDPIPTQKGHVHDPKRMSLADCPVGTPQQIARIVNQEPDFLQFVERQGLMPGTTVTVEGRVAAAETVLVRQFRKPTVSLGLGAAENILVEVAASRR
ncbi:MAG: metal-dependent transcriptional regulator [Tepidisphaeraceae bacterium]|jgi:DtxR family Mn-dependent transcriptional regulator